MRMRRCVDATRTQRTMTQLRIRNTNAALDKSFMLLSAFIFLLLPSPALHCSAPSLSTRAANWRVPHDRSNEQ